MTTAARLSDKTEARRLVFRHALRGLDEFYRAAVAAEKEIASAVEKATKSLEALRTAIDDHQRAAASVRQQLGGIRAHQEELLLELEQLQDDDQAVLP